MIFRSFLLFLCCGVVAESVCAVEPQGVTVQVGIENAYKNGLWTPITVEVFPPLKIETLALRCSDADGTPITYHFKAEGQEKITVLAKLGRKDEPILVSLNGGELQSFPVPPPVNAERPIYLVIGSGDMGLQGAVAELALKEDRRPLLVHVKSFDNLPDQWFGYESVEMVVLTTTDPKLLAGLTVESPQIKALHDWLQYGGKMFLCAGKNAGQFLEEDKGFLRLFLPGTFAEMTELRTGTPFELFVNSKRQIFMNGTDESPFMKMPRFTNPRGITFVKDGDLQLVLRCAHGLGTLMYFGGDLSERPLSNWRDRSALVRNILQWNTEKRSGTDPRSGAMLQLGYNDIAGQIRSALDKFAQVRILPFSIVLIILTAYWLVIGLFDWFVVHKILKRPILTWVTFPLWIVLFCGLTYGLAAPGRPSEGVRNVLTVSDFDGETRRYRISTWRSEYSPVDKQFHFENTIPATTASGYFSWNGLSGSGLGGMAPKTVSPPIWQIGSQQNSYNELREVPIQTRATKSFFSQHGDTYPEEMPTMSAKLTDEEGIPLGSIQVHENFAYSMENAILVYGRWMLELGTIKPGQTLKLTKTTPRRELRELLIPPKMLENTELRGKATYNPQSADLEYIVRVMSLYRVLGGYEATGLHNAYQPSLDMSDLLSADKVLLLGTANNSDHRTAANQSEDVLSIFRYSFHIELTSLSPRLNIERQEYVPDALEEKATPSLLKDSLGNRR